MGDQERTIIEPKKKLRILIACEESQVVCKAFRERGHEAYSCDIQECSGGHPEWHLQMDAFKALYGHGKWDLVIAHPPCTRIANSGVRWLASKVKRPGYSWNEANKIYLRNDENIWKDLYDAVKFFNGFILYGKLGHKIAIENPIPHRYAKMELTAEYTQIVNLWWFGHMETKQTCLWLFGLDELVETKNVYKEMMELPYAERAKVHYASPGTNRAKLRSETRPGFAKAMAEQWG